MEISEKIMMQGNNFNQRLVVHLPTDICRTIIGSGGSGGYHAGNEPKVIVKSKEKTMIRLDLVKRNEEK